MGFERFLAHLDRFSNARGSNRAIDPYSNEELQNLLLKPYHASNLGFWGTPLCQTTISIGTCRVPPRLILRLLPYHGGIGIYRFCRRNRRDFEDSILYLCSRACWPVWHRVSS